MKTKLLLLAALFVAPLLRAQTVDQQQLSSDGGLSGRAIPGYGYFQTFVAGATGTLSQVDLGFFGTITNGTALLKVLQGDPKVGGTVTLWSGNVTVNSAGNYALNSFAVAAPVTAGTTYTIQIFAVDLPDPYGLLVYTQNGYPAGKTGYTYPPPMKSYYWPAGWSMVFRTWVR